MPESVVRGSALSIFAGWGTLVLGIGVNVVLARVLGPELKGILAIFLATQGALALPGFAVQLGIVRFIAQRRPDWSRLKHSLDGVAIAQAIVSVALLAAAVQVPAVREVLLGGLDQHFLWLMLLAIVPILVFMYRSALLSGIGTPGVGAVWGAVSSLVQSGVLLLPVLWWYWSGASPEVGAVIIASSVATAVGSSVWALATARATVTGGTPIPFRATTVAVVSFAAPVLLRTVAEWVNRRLDVYFVQAFAGPRELGLYTVAVGLGQQSWLIPVALAGPVFARVSALGDGPASRHLAQYTFRLTAGASAGFGLAMALLVPQVLPLVYGDRFSGAIPLLWLLLPGVVAIGPTVGLNSYFSAIGRPAEPLKAELFAGALTVLLLAAFTPSFGAVGAAVASSCAYFGYSAWLCVRFVQVSASRWPDLLRPRMSDWTNLMVRLRGYHLIQAVLRRRGQRTSAR